jgi:N-acyl-D-amino-acid deacylase
MIREGMAADIIVFDAAGIADESTYDEGKALAVGMVHVVVNGEPILKNGKRTAALPGRGLRRG